MPDRGENRADRDAEPRHLRAGDSVTVLDLGVEAEYFDHHQASALPAHRLLHLNINPAPDMCTSLLTTRMLARDARGSGRNAGRVW